MTTEPITNRLAICYNNHNVSDTYAQTNFTPSFGQCVCVCVFDGHRVDWEPVGWQLLFIGGWSLALLVDLYSEMFPV